MTADPIAGPTPFVTPPVVVLVAPQLGENVGAAARAMLNCGWSALRLVRPRDGWPNPAAVASAAGADAVIDGVRVYDTTAEAVADLTAVFATTARPRHMVKPVVDPVEAARRLHDSSLVGERPGILFGGERSGLDNDDVALADTVLTVPLNPGFSSLNLAQAVLVVSWCWRQHNLGLTGERGSGPCGPNRPIWSHSGQRDVEPAPRGLGLTFFAHLEQELDAAGFFKVAEKRPSMVRNLRSIFLRAMPTAQEIRTLHGVVTALSDRRKGGAPRQRRANGAEDDADNV